MKENIRVVDYCPYQTQLYLHPLGESSYLITPSFGKSCKVKQIPDLLFSIGNMFYVSSHSPFQRGSLLPPVN